MKDELVPNENKRLKLAKLFNDTLYYVNDKSGLFSVYQIGYYRIFCVQVNLMHFMISV